MNKLKITALSAAIGLAISASAMGASLSEAQYKSAGQRISARHTADLATCEALAGNRKDVCNAEADGRQNVAKAELELSYGDSDKHRHDVRIAKADAAYAIANEKCDDLADANATASEATKAADKQAALEKRNAAYAIAKEKCDSLANDAKVTCIQEAKARYGQS